MTSKNELTVTATELARRTGELLRLAEHGTTITVVDGKHPDWVRAIIIPPPVPPGQGRTRSGSAGSAG
ncbi:MAG TPA: hypothetical protein VHS32_20355 [Streptosporangiaceae bacterium]|jgi:hypothetical protein|nr:hypothetical protein [Streptosporangiaceae bacterium]